MVAQPQADEVALAVRFGVVDKSRAAVAERPVVDKLDLSGLEIEIDRQVRLLEDVEHCRHRRRAFIVDRLAAQCVSAIHLVGAEPRSHFNRLPECWLEYGRQKNRGFPGPEFALAVEPERSV